MPLGQGIRGKGKLQFYTENILHTLVEETVNMAVLDSGCTKTVCGEKWLQNYLEFLPTDETNNLKEKSESIFRFGDSEEIKALNQ